MLNLHLSFSLKDCLRALNTSWHQKSLLNTSAGFTDTLHVEDHINRIASHLSAGICQENYILNGFLVGYLEHD